MDFKKNYCRYCIAELTFEFNKASDYILTFPRIQVESTAVRTLDNKHGLPVHRFYHAALAPKRRNGAETTLGLRYGDCRFLPNANCGEKSFESGGKMGGSVGFPETRHFLGGLSFIPAEDIDQIKLAFTYRGLKHTGPHPRINNTKM